MKLSPDGLLAIGWLIVTTGFLSSYILSSRKDAEIIKDRAKIAQQKADADFVVDDVNRHISELQARWDKERNGLRRQIEVRDRLIEDADLAVPDPRSPNFPEYCRFLKVDPADMREVLKTWPKVKN